MELTKDQIDSFNQNGFLLLKNFANSDLCDDIASLARKHLDKKIEPIESEEEYSQKGSDERSVRRLRQAYSREPLFAQWMTNEKIRPILKQLLGEKINLVLANHNSIMTKQPYVSSATLWHQDIRYWHYENSNLMSVWLSLGDEYLENGLLEFIAGSHKLTFTRDQFDEHMNFRSDLPKNQEIIKNRVHNDLKKGDVVLFHAKVLHYANLNSTKETKLSFVYTVRAASNMPLKQTRSDSKDISL